MTTHLVIPDSHAHPEYNNNRFLWLGRLIMDIKPDVIINIGDMADMPSLCSYDVGKVSFEGRRYTKDIQANIDANTKLFQAQSEYNSNQRRNKRSLYKPRKVLLYGNHEHRIVKATENDSKLQGVIGLKDLKNENFDWETHDFLDVVNIDGVYYSHFFTSGVMGRPVSGEHPAHSLLTKKFSSCTQGHVHTRDFCERTMPNGQKIQALVAGCYFDYNSEFAGIVNDMYWRGIVIKRNVKNGTYDHEWVSMDTIKNEYR